MDENKALKKLQSMAESICDCYCIYPREISTQSEMERVCADCPLDDYICWFTDHMASEDGQNQAGWKKNIMERFCKVN